MTKPEEEPQNERKICPMPSCRNEVRRGRYCNSCQKRKESLNRTLAQQGIHLTNQRRVRNSTSIENLTSLAQTSFVFGKQPNEATSGDVMIGSRKKYKAEDEAVVTKPLAISEPIYPVHHAPDSLYHQDLTRSSSLSSLSEGGFSSNYHSNSSSTMSINSLLSPASPTQGRSRTSSISSETDSMDVDTSRPTGRYFTMEDQLLLQQKIMEDQITKLDEALVELAGGEQQASRLLRKYLTSSVGRTRLAPSGSSQNPNGQ